jgi:hypothetical protein
MSPSPDYHASPTNMCACTGDICILDGVGNVGGLILIPGNSLARMCRDFAPTG